MKLIKNYLYPVVLLAGVACTDVNKTEKLDSGKNYSLESSELFKEITLQDSIMFSAYNSYDLDKMMSFFDSSLEFYHDKRGLTNFVQSREGLQYFFKKNTASGFRRDPIAGSIEVYPIKNYGAIETGMHRFCNEENGKQHCDTFKFLHIWQKKNGQWKVTRVASYDHK